MDIKKEDFENLLSEYWYVLQCGKSGCKVFSNEINQKEAYFNELVKLYKWEK